ncbi:MauE/DoxX family redox-associated membrane protein [Olivibacter sp. XZL3]|uniref:MauE/DoxX family redox-associated membrane protein n=1 Tax=Olivibacter sp. XZL3 TaxID=1735116 RepID=UPI0010666576|nr:MauE/DoxX family redox-associated membrane protein [Olivibacter sp. XZL3]
MKREKIINALTAFIAMMFFYAIVSKLSDYEEAHRQMRNQVFPDAIADILTWLIPLIELLILGCLVYKPKKLLGLWASFALLSGFCLYIILGMNKFFDRIPCSCGGILSEDGTYRDQLNFNLVFIVFALIAIALEKRWFNRLIQFKKYKRHIQTIG